MAKYIIKRKRNGKEEICVVIPYRDSKTGKRRQIWRSAESMTEARSVRDEELRKIDKHGTKLYEHKLILNQYLDQWLTFVRPTIRDITYEDYESNLRRYVRPEIGAMKVSEIQAEHIQAIVESMMQRGLAPRTIQYMHRVISLALKAAVKPPFSLIAFNPADYVSLPRKRKIERLWLTDETMQTFLDALDTEKFGLIFEFALVSGMRPEEYLALKWMDIDLMQSTATVNRTLTRKRKATEGGQNWKFEETKNESSRRLVPLPRYLMPKLLEHKRQQNEQRLKTGKHWQDYNLVFSSSIGSPLNLANLQFRHYKPLLKKVGLEKMRLYDLRHSFASLLLKVREEPGKPSQPAVPLKVVSEMLGHNDPYTTARFYQHVDESMKRQASNAMESIVRKSR